MEVGRNISISDSSSEENVTIISEPRVDNKSSVPTSCEESSGVGIGETRSTSFMKLQTYDALRPSISAPLNGEKMLSSRTLFTQPRISITSPRMNYATQHRVDRYDSNSYLSDESVKYQLENSQQFQQYGNGTDV